MVPLLWVGLVGASMGAGAALALLLVVPRPREGLVMVLGVLSMGGAVAAGNGLVAAYETTSLTVIASLLAVAALGGGFALVSALLAYVQPASPGPLLPPAGSPPRTLVVLMVDTETRAYLAGEVSREIAELVEAGLPEPTIGVMPFHYAAQKARYRAIAGRSPEHAAAVALSEGLESLLDGAEFAGPVVVRCSDRGALAANLRASLDEGYASVVVTGAYIADSYRAAEQRRDVDDIAASITSLRVAYTPPLWASDELARLVALRAVALTAGSGRTGVALLVHGQPGRHAEANASFDVEENAFANRVRMHLGEHGIDEAYVRVCYAEWSDPGVTETVRHLAALGSERILVVPACYPFANMQTLLDIPAAERDARVPENVHVVHIPPWGDDEVFASVLAGAIRQAAAETAAWA
jgi:protoheme ferro-lyase